MKGQVLIVLHQENSTPGRVGLALKARGYRLDIRRPRFGDPLPETLDEHAAAIIFGGPMSANDPDDYIRREIDWIGVPLAENRPLLGICLGAQMLVRHMGGSVGESPEGRVEIGYYPLCPTEAGRQVMAWPDQVYQWHREWMRPVAGCEVLALGGDDEVQVCRAGERAFAVQFHAELTLAMVHRWTVRGAHRFDDPGAQPRAEHFEGRMRHDRAIREWLERFLDLWLAL